MSYIKKENLCEGHHSFDSTPSFLCRFLSLSLSNTLPKSHTYWMAPIKIIILLWTAITSVWCQKYETLLQFDTSWLASLRTWHYFRLFWLQLFWLWPYINHKELHIKLLFVFTKKFLLKTKTYKLVVGNCGSSIYSLNKKLRKG